MKKEKKKRPWWKKMLIVLGSVLAVLVLAVGIFLAFWRPIYVHLKSNIYEKELATAQMGEIVFFGDSITDTYDLAAYYPGYTIYNRGISGDATHHLLERMDDVYKLEPSVIVLLVGTNDFMNESRPLSDVVADYEKILQGFKANCPDAVVICQSVYPGGDWPKSKMAQWQQETVQLNTEIARLAQKYGYVYADVYSVLVDGDHMRIDPIYSEDGVHPNAAGYEVITAYLTPYIEAAYAEVKAR